jgi:hypothetical protein
MAITTARSNRNFEETQGARSNLVTSRGAATQFKEGGENYEVRSHMYPEDLLNDQRTYGGNYVIFYINVAVDSKLAKTKGTKFVNETTPRDRGDLIGQNLSTNQLKGSNAALNLAGATIGSALGFGQVAPAVAAISTVGAGVVANQAASATRAQKRLKTAIALHVPNQLQIRYGVQYSEEDTLALSMMSATGQGLSEIIQAAKDSEGSAKSAAGQQLGPAAAIISNIALSKGPFGAANSAATGLAANPKKEQVFKGVDFRTFQFDYQFFPRGIEEAENVMRIIEEFKYHMHPEFKDDNNFLYIYPSEFDIFYYQDGRENLNLHRHTSCVMTDMTVNYTPNGTFTTFDNGMPTQINVVMSFRELALLTKDKIKDGL